MFRLKPLRIDTLGEHVIFLHEAAVRLGNLGFRPLDRVRVFGDDPVTGSTREVTGILNFCDEPLVAPDDIGLSAVTARDLGLPAGTLVQATLAPAPRSVDLVRAKLQGQRLDRSAFGAILADVVQHRYSKVELSMFVLACALQTLDLDELVAYTEAMVAAGTQLHFGPGPIADKHQTLSEIDDIIESTSPQKNQEILTGDSNCALLSTTQTPPPCAPCLHRLGSDRV